MIGKNFIKEIKERGLIDQITDEKALSERLERGPIVLYCGFDPTADSLHIGHLIPLLCLKRFQLAGHKPCALVGGATGLIGDPSFKATERALNNKKIVNLWTENICHQISRFLDCDCGGNSCVVINNREWFKGMKVLTFLRDIGKHFSVNKMIKKEAVKQRLNRNTSGISFTEFSYSLLQSFDFSELCHRHQVELQIGGSDQWGNIISGIDLTRRLHKKTVFGLTFPLITQSDGTKFGKTERGAIWLSAEKTSPYTFYQFWMNTSDADVYQFLKFFTFLSLDDINALEKADQNSSGAPRAQYVLAELVTNIVHGSENLAAAKRISQSLFSGILHEMIESDFVQLTREGVPTIKISKGTDLQQALVYAELAPSRGRARSMIGSNGISINGKKQANVAYIFGDSDRIFGRYTLLLRGRRHYCLIEWK